MDIKKYIDYLKKTGWYSLREPQWIPTIREELKEEFPNITDEELNEVLYGRA